MMSGKISEILTFHNKKVDGSIINHEQIMHLVINLNTVLETNIEGDVVELGCYVGESSKYLRKTLDTNQSDKKLYVYDSFEGLPELSEWEENTGWRPFTLKTTEDVLVSNFRQNNLNPPDRIVKGWFKDIKQEDLPEKISFAFLDGDFYDSIYDSLVKVYDRMVEGGMIFFHDYLRHDLPGVDAAIRDFFRERGIHYDVEEVCGQLGKFIVKGKSDEVFGNKLQDSLEIEIRQESEKVVNQEGDDSDITIVTGIWNIKRDELSEGWSRSYKHYIEKFKQILSIPNNMIIFGDDDLSEFIFDNPNRTTENTQFIKRTQDWFKNHMYNEIQSIRNNPEWKNQAGWLVDSTQSRLEMYNPLVMSKPFLLNDARIFDKFNSKRLYWLDGGISNTVHPGYFTHDRVLRNLKDNNKITFVAFPYEAENEIHGFDYKYMCELTNAEVDKVCRGGFFGGSKEAIEKFNNEYYGLMATTLGNGYMGTEESIFSILLYTNPSLYEYYSINYNGLLSKFFEDLKNNEHEVKSEKKRIMGGNTNLDVNKVALYILTFNSPKQVETLFKSMLYYDQNFLQKPDIYLIDNSTDLSTYNEYKILCDEYSAIHLKMDENLGVCGGRQYAAEHADDNDYDYYLFFEDDMFFYQGKEGTCRNGFPRHFGKLYDVALEIINKEDFDFLKLSFSEFYGDNSTQWSWYNVPQSVREEYWPDYNKLPRIGLDPNAPKTVFNNIKIHNGLPYSDGEVYYSNWPQLVSKTGNKKMFLDTKWASPHEQTWMSFMFQETKKNVLKPGILLLSPTEHDRFDHYEASLRKES